MNEFQNLEKGEDFIDDLLQETEVKAPVINFSELYGFDYGIF